MGTLKNGFILLESLLALMVITMAMIIVTPILLSLHPQKISRDLTELDTAQSELQRFYLTGDRGSLSVSSLSPGLIRASRLLSNGKRLSIVRYEP